MRFFVLICILLTATYSLPNKASYVRAEGRPLNIAHRGLASILPENTL